MFCEVPNCRVGLVGLVVMLFSPVGVAAGDSIELELKFPPGRRQYIELSAEGHQVVKGPMVSGGQMDITINQITGVMERVESSSKEGAKIVFSYDRRGMTFEYPGMGRLHYDSDMPGEDDAPYIEQMFSPVLGMSMTMELDESARVKSFSGMDAIFKKIEAAAAGNPLFAQMKAGFTNDAAKATWGDNRWTILPDHAVKPGDTWNCRSENDVPQIGKLVSDFSCKLERVTESNGRKLAIITFTGKITQPAKIDESAQAGGMGLKVKGGTIKGTTTFDIEAGQIINQARETQLLLEMPSSGGDGAPAMQVTTESKETLVVRTLAERDKEKQENLAKARAKKAEAKKAEADAEKAESKKGKTDSE